MHSCVLSNAGLCNALTETGICTFLFRVLFTNKYKVGIAEFYQYMGFSSDLLKNVPENWDMGIRTPLKSASYFRFV